MLKINYQIDSVKAEKLTEKKEILETRKSLRKQEMSPGTKVRYKEYNMKYVPKSSKPGVESMIKYDNGFVDGRTYIVANASGNYISVKNKRYGHPKELFELV